MNGTSVFQWRHFFIAIFFLLIIVVLLELQNSDFSEVTTELVPILMATLAVTVIARVCTGMAQLGLCEFSGDTDVLLFSKIIQPSRFMIVGCAFVAFTASGDFLWESPEGIILPYLPFLVWFFLLESVKRTPKKGTIHEDEFGNKYYPQDVLPPRHTYFFEELRKVERKVLWSDGTKSLISQHYRLCPEKTCTFSLLQIMSEALKNADGRIDSALKQSDTSNTNIIERIAQVSTPPKNYTWVGEPMISKIES